MLCLYLIEAYLTASLGSWADMSQWYIFLVYRGVCRGLQSRNVRQPTVGRMTKKMRSLQAAAAAARLTTKTNTWQVGAGAPTPPPPTPTKVSPLTRTSPSRLKCRGRQKCFDCNQLNQRQKNFNREEKEKFSD